MNELAPQILGNIDASDAAPALQQILLAVDATTILAITDAKGTILHVNDKFCEISKFSREELVGENHRIVQSGYHEKSFFVEMWKTISSGKTWNGEIKNRAKDGSHYWVETSIVPFLDDNNKPHRYAAIRKDITDKKNLSEQIAEERAKSINSEKMAALGEMAAGIAHEVGNPLAAMRGRVEMLMAKVGSGNASNNDVSSSAKTILDLIDRTTKIIRGLRAYARDASKDPMAIANIYTLVDETLEFSMNRLKENRIELIKEFSNKPLQVICREAEIGQVLVNLINNACDILKECEQRKIKVRVYPDAEDVVVEVEDTGPGVPIEVRNSMFNPFFTTKAAGKGTGLGLSISKRIMDSHSGNLHLLEKDQTCFQFRWPISRESAEGKI